VRCGLLHAPAPGHGQSASSIVYMSWPNGHSYFLSFSKESQVHFGAAKINQTLMLGYVMFENDKLHHSLGAVMHQVCALCRIYWPWTV
jgi:hypothetical protein